MGEEPLKYKKDINRIVIWLIFVLLLIILVLTLWVRYEADKLEESIDNSTLDSKLNITNVTVEEPELVLNTSLDNITEEDVEPIEVNYSIAEVELNNS